MQSIQWKICKECNGRFPMKFFPKRRKKSRCMHTSTYYRSRICMGCRDKKRDEGKAKNRFIQKAKDSIRRHADKYIDLGIVTSREEFMRTFGWSVKQLAHDFEFQYGNGCVICHQPYEGMGHGPSDITIDIIDPESLPYYETNKQFACHTCNGRKQRTPPEDYGEVMLGYRIWEEHQEGLVEDKWAGTLFAGISTTVQLELM